jgi:hypothetical protein
MIGGGASFDFPSGDLSASSPSGNGWFARGENNGTVAQTLNGARALSRGLTEAGPTAAGR